MLMLPSCEKDLLPEGEKQEDNKENVSDNGNGSTGNTDNSTGGDTGSSNGTQNNPSDDSYMTVGMFLDAAEEEDLGVAGYIVGTAYKNIKNADFEAPFEYSTALLLADDRNETSLDRVITIELKSGSKMRNELDLTVHPELQYRRLAVRGKKVKYLYTWGIKGASSYSLLE